MIIFRISLAINNKKINKNKRTECIWYLTSCISFIKNYIYKYVDFHNVYYLTLYVYIMTFVFIEY